MLLLVLRNSLNNAPGESLGCEKNTTEINKDATLGDAALKGIIGNFSFYLVFLLVFIVLKAMGTLDSVFQGVIQGVQK